MERLFLIWNQAPSAITIAAECIALGVFTLIVFKIIRMQVRASKRRFYPKDVVILHQFPRATKAPSLSPFPIKLETW
jgi:hypothetical protein